MKKFKKANVYEQIFTIILDRNDLKDINLKKKINQIEYFFFLSIPREDYG